MQISQQIGPLAGRHADLLAARLQQHRAAHPPAHRASRRFTSGEVAALLGVRDAYLRKLSLEGRGPQPETGQGGRRLYTSENIRALRHMLEAGAKTPGTYLPGRRPGDPAPIIALCGATPVTAHVAQKCALDGFTVLALDFDPAGGLTALLGPETLAGLRVQTGPTPHAEPETDLILLDCPAHALPQAISTATTLILAARPTAQDLAALDHNLHALADAQATADLLYLVTGHDPADAAQTQLAGILRALFGDHVLPQTLPDLPSDHTLYDIARPRAAEARALDAVNALAADLQRRIRRAWGRPT
ncbi:MAG: hypothetical protein KDK24_13770 [Pseudooceanicola sp.]|nr:hypothetical protein [Pseudooceanicola sp.]